LSRTQNACSAITWLVGADLSVLNNQDWLMEQATTLSLPGLADTVARCRRKRAPPCKGKKKRARAASPDKKKKKKRRTVAAEVVDLTEAQQFSPEVELIELTPPPPAAKDHGTSDAVRPADELQPVATHAVDPATVRNASLDKARRGRGRQHDREPSHSRSRSRRRRRSRGRTRSRRCSRSRHHHHHHRRKEHDRRHDGRGRTGHRSQQKRDDDRWGDRHRRADRHRRHSSGTGHQHFDEDPGLNRSAAASGKARERADSPFNEPTGGWVNCGCICCTKVMMPPLIALWCRHKCPVSPCLLEKNETAALCQEDKRIALSPWVLTYAKL